MKLIKFDLPLNEKKVRNIEELRENVTIELLAHLKSGLLRKWLKSRGLSDFVVKVEAIVIKEDSETFYELCSVLDIAIALNDATTMIRQANLAQQQAQVESAKQIEAKLKEEQRLNELQEAKVFEYRTDKELKSIVKKDEKPTINNTVFPNTPRENIWCSAPWLLLK